MYMLLLPKIRQKGTAFLEIVISIGILAVLVHAIASLVIASYDILGVSRTRISARHLANEKIELTRNLPYDQIGVVGGIPAGVIFAEEKVFRNGLEYTIQTSVVFIDDPFDGLAPGDTLPIDYKRVRVEVSWGGLYDSSATVIMITDVAPKGSESAGEGGVLLILVFDAQAQPVEGAQVRIQNSQVVPVIDATLNTDVKGEVMLPGTPACFECYNIEVSKDGYNQEKTYTTAEVANPDKPPATVNDQQGTVISFGIDRTSTLQIGSTQDRDGNYAPLLNQFFQLTGSKIIGTDIQDQPVYKYDELLQTDGSGNLIISDMEWDLYTLTLPASSWDLAGTNPFSPFALMSNSTLGVLFASTAHTDNSVLFIVAEASGSGVAEANVRLTNASGFDDSVLSGNIDTADFGQGYMGSLLEDTFTVEATKSGYVSTSFQMSVSGTGEELIILNRE